MEEIPAVVIVPADEYLAVRSRLLFEETWWRPDDDGRSGAQAFLAHFDASRGGEWGHVAFCIEKAIQQMRHDAREED